ncbi:MAG: hypothetical protein ACUVWP_00200 [bacterium]
MRNYCSIFLILFFLFSNGLTDGNWAGGFMRVGIDPAVMALGFAGTTLAPLSTSTYWNPALLAFCDKSSVSTSMTRLSMDRRLYYGLVAARLGENAGFGGGWLRGEVIDVDLRDYDGDKYGSFDYPQNAFIFSFGRSIVDIVGVGITYIYHHYKLYRVHANGSQLNIGLLTNYKGFRVGFTVDNLYSKLDWDSVSIFSTGRDEKFPIRFKIGSGLITYNSRIKIIGEFWLMKDRRGSFHLGTEANLSDDITLRGGINDGDVTFGGGFRFNLSKGSILIDYSYIQDCLGMTAGNSISLSYIF